MSSLNIISPTFVGTFIRQINMLQMVGVDIFNDTNSPFIRKHARFMVYVTMLLFMFVGQVLYVVRRKEVGASFLDVVNAIPSILVVIQNMVKLVVVTVKRNEIKQLTLEIGQLWMFDYGNDKKNEEMHFWVRRLKIWSNVIFGAMGVSMMFFAFVPLIVTIYRCYTEPKPEYKFLLEMYFFSHVDSHITYSIGVTFQVIMCTLCQIFTYTPCDYLLLHQSFSLAALLSLVQTDLLSLKRSNLKDLHFYGDDNCEDIRRIVRTHQRLLSLAERLNKIFKEMIFSQVYLSSVIICCYSFTSVVRGIIGTYNIISRWFQMSKSGVAPFLGDLMASVAVIVEIFILAVPGQVIADTSSGIAYAAYQTPWYERSYKFRKFIAIVIVRAQKPFRLSALGFSDLTLVMFSKVLSTTWSYLSLLNQMTENLDV